MPPTTANDLRDDSLIRTGFAGPLDAAVEYIRLRLGWIFPLYVLAAGPLILLGMAAISTIVTHDATATPFFALLALPALVWRWCWLTVIQARVQEELSAKRPSGVLKRLPFVLVIRLAIAPLVLWGTGLLIFPALMAMAAGTMATPLLLDAPNTGWKQIKKLFRHSIASGRAMKLAGLLALIFIALGSGIYGVLELLGQFILPSLMGVSDPRISLIINSSAMALGFDFFTLLALDLLWCVTGVILYNELEARRTGADLRVRLQSQMEASP